MSHPWDVRYVTQTSVSPSNWWSCPTVHQVDLPLTQSSCTTICSTPGFAPQPEIHSSWSHMDLHFHRARDTHRPRLLTQLGHGSWWEALLEAEGQTKKAHMRWWKHLMLLDKMQSLESAQLLEIFSIVGSLSIYPNTLLVKLHKFRNVKWRSKRPTCLCSRKLRLPLAVDTVEEPGRCKSANVAKTFGWLSATLPREGFWPQLRLT